MNCAQHTYIAWKAQAKFSRLWKLKVALIYRKWKSTQNKINKFHTHYVDVMYLYPLSGFMYGMEMLFRSTKKKIPHLIHHFNFVCVLYLFIMVFILCAYRQRQLTYVCVFCKCFTCIINMRLNVVSNIFQLFAQTQKYKKKKS